MGSAGMAMSSECPQMVLTQRSADGCGRKGRNGQQDAERYPLCQAGLQLRKTFSRVRGKSLKILSSGPEWGREDFPGEEAPG